MESLTANEKLFSLSNTCKGIAESLKEEAKQYGDAYSQIYAQQIIDICNIYYPLPVD